MDSWTDAQLAIMKGGGNEKCNQYLKSKGIDPRAPIKQKYESDAAQLYKEVLKARIEGRPEPTTLPPKTQRTPSSAPSSMNRPMGGFSGGGGAGGGGDPNGMERLQGESEQQYVARQTRLREEARARMQAKFGGGGKMGGVGSNPGYNPNGNYGGSGMDDVMAGVTSVFSTGLSFVGGAASTVTSSVSGIVNDPSAPVSLASLGATAGSFWGSLSSAASQVASTIAQPDGDDGLEALQREFAQNKPAQSKYAGFGSSNAPGMGNAMGSMASAPAASSGVQEAPGLPGEDRNGVGRLTGESDEQYVMRQTRLRDEAKARMAAKFGGGGLSSASSSSAPYGNPAPSSGNAASPYRPSPAPSSGNFGGLAAAPASGGFRGAQPPPRSGGMTPPRKLSSDSADDFFASFGT